MNIIKKESLIVSHNEDRAIDIVAGICHGCVEHSSNPDLITLCQRISDDIYTLWLYIDEVVE